MNRYIFSLLAASLFLLNACSLAPDYTQPGAPIPEHWPAGDAYERHPAVPAASGVSKMSAGTFLGDKKLQKLIEMALAVQGTIARQISAQQSVVSGVEKIYHLSTMRYKRGIDSYLSVLDAQRSLYAAQQGLVALSLAKLSNQVTLYAVLGGDSARLQTN